MTTEPTPLRVEQYGPVRWLTLNRRRHLNAINTDMIELLMREIESAGSDAGTRCLVITGANAAFSSGQDIDEVIELEATDGPSSVGVMLRDRYAPLVILLRELPIPVIAAINGVATGAGLALALACDIRIASERSSFITAPFRIGLMPAVGLSILLPAILGYAKAIEVCTLGERLTATEAAHVGLVYRTVPDDEFNAVVAEAAERLAALPARAFAMTKEAFNSAAIPQLRDQLEREVAWQVEAAISPDHSEGLRSFKERRTPNFNQG
jgi:2-(1,2-epoxy-1,2-dihydrophenyl)acetyl-CoA isomerase